jgi:Cellulase (glycosyl hydrolase family 5)
LLSKLIGINFHGYGCAVYQNRYTPSPPQNYIEDSFEIFAENGITCVRVIFYWESWELDATQCCLELNEISKAADKYGIMCIYDNHQWECSSWIGCGIGMPNSVMSRYYDRKAGNHVPDYCTKKDFWTKWWNRRVETVNGIEGWDAQLDYFINIVELLKNHKSTFGFEILNEPEVYNIFDYRKVRLYHDYMIKGLRRITDKPLLFCWALPHGGVVDTPILQALASPTLKDNIIYDGHSYPPSLSRMIYFRMVTLLMGNIPLYIGEFNSGFTNSATVTQEQLSEYVKRFRRFRTHGWAIWRWSYIQDQNIPAFNLTQIIDNRIQPGSHFTKFINAINTANKISEKHSNVKSVY